MNTMLVPISNSSARHFAFSSGHDEAPHWQENVVISAADKTAVATSFALLDEALSGGWPRGALTEILLEGVGIGELSLLLPALAKVRAEGGWSLLVAPPYLLHAPTLDDAAADLQKLVVICPVAATVSPAEKASEPYQSARASASANALWAAEQALQSGAPSVVLCWADQLDARQVRRLQVAAAASHSVAFLLRPATAENDVSAAPLRLKLAAGKAGELDLTVFKRRGPPLSESLLLSLRCPARWKSHESALAGNTLQKSST